MDTEIVAAIEKAISYRTGGSIQIQSLKPVGGGCINQTFKAVTTGKNYFVKMNNASAFPGMFDAEVNGLKLLKNAMTISVPETIVTGTEGNESFLVLEWIEPGKRVKDFFEDFGRKMAGLHACTHSFFGLEEDYYIGSLKQLNKPCNSFGEFFIHQRLEVQLKMAVDSGRLPATVLNSFEKLYSRLQEIIPPEKPALLHGDLWNGNYMTGADGYACIFDPAVYYGHREMDLAMTILFGGFERDFYESYHRHFPLEKNWRTRVDIFNLYPLLVHVNLFGGGYSADVMGIVKRF